MNPKDLTGMFEAICGSGDLKAKYDELKEKRDKAAQAHKMAEQKRKGVAAERKQCREQMEEADRFQSLSDLRDRLVSNHILFQCFHIERGLFLLPGSFLCVYFTGAFSSQLVLLCKLWSDVTQQKELLETHEREEAELIQTRETVEASLRGKKQESAKLQNQKVALQKQIKTESAKLDKKQPDFIKVQQETTHMARRRVTALAAEQRAREAAGLHTAAAAKGEKDLAAAQAAFAAKHAKQGGEAAGVTLTVVFVVFLLNFPRRYLFIAIVQAEQMEEYAALQQSLKAKTSREQQQLDTIVDGQQAARAALAKVRLFRLDFYMNIVNTQIRSDSARRTWRASKASWNARRQTAPTNSSATTSCRRRTSAISKRRPRFIYIYVFLFFVVPVAHTNHSSNRPRTR
jgi:structural maintenance of chromosome 1